jgi:hypothetical protein
MHEKQEEYQHHVYCREGSRWGAGMPKEDHGVLHSFHFMWILR